jgi:hypothetical protein
MLRATGLALLGVDNPHLAADLATEEKWQVAVPDADRSR